MNEQNHVPTILAVSCQKGGEGKTTSAWHIGAALTQRGYKVCLIDCDPAVSYTHLDVYKRQSSCCLLDRVYQPV